MNNPDYRGPLLQLELSLNAAKALGYSVPLNFDIALRLMRGELRVPLYSELDRHSAFGIITSGEYDEDEQDELFALYIKTAKGQRERRRVAKAIETFARGIEDTPAEEAAPAIEGGKADAA